MLFNGQDGELLRWLSAETDDEQRCIEDEPQKRQVGWREWRQDSGAHREAGEDET